MSATLGRLRQTIDGLWQELAAERLQRARAAPSPSGMSARAELVRSPRCEELLQQLREEASVSPREALWLSRHIAALRYALSARDALHELDRAIAAVTLDGGRSLSLSEELSRLSTGSDDDARHKLSREIDLALRPALSQYVSAHIDAAVRVEPLRRAAPPKPASRGPGLIISLSDAIEGEPVPAEDPEYLGDARRFISETDAAAEDCVRFVSGERSTRRTVSWHALLHGLRASDLDAPHLAGERFRRCAAVFRAVGLEPVMAAHMRAEVARRAITPLPSLVALRVPQDVRVAQSPVDWGLLSDLGAAGFVGRAVALSLVLRVLPVELRRPLDGGVPEAVGMLSMQLWGERAFLMRMQGLPGSAAERVARLAASSCLLSARLSAAVAAVSFAGVDTPGQRIELLAQVASRALCCEVPETYAGLACADRLSFIGELRGALAGLALHHGLREAYDEDWFRNPRTGDRLRDTLAHGNAVSAEQLCEDMGVGEGDTVARIHELLA